jgi:hypothetical protein
MMRFWYDCEFIDDSKVIDLISIGMVCEDGRELYLQSVDFDEYKASDWVQQNVISHLAQCPCCGHKVNHDVMGKCRHNQCPWRTHEQIRDEILAFVNAGDGKPEFWSWISSYDHVALTQLFGTMMDYPHEWTHYTRDFQYILDERGISDDELPQQDEGVHHALEDARHLKKLWGYIVRNDAWQ